jgi:regulator of chromosome condensation (RCC1) repeat-containing protein
MRSLVVPRRALRSLTCVTVLAATPACFSPIVEVDGGGGRTCGRRENGWVRCWGVGNTVPTDVLDSYRFASITVGSTGSVAVRAHACGRLDNTNSETVCWPHPSTLPTGSPPQSPITVPGGHAFTFVNSGDYQSCGIDGGGIAWCWTGITGSGAASTPQQLPGGHTWQKLSGGQGFSCGITTAGDAYCFGDAFSGQLGTTSDPNLQSCTHVTGATGYCASVPVAVAGGHKFSEISAGAGGACALDTAGAAWCWGKFTGNDATRDSPTPVAVDGGRTYTRIASANAHKCALTAAGEVFCWGFGKYGQLGDGTGDGINASFAHSPVAVATPARYRAISADDLMSCAVVLDGTRVDCWGWNRNGELSRVDPAAPTNVPGEARW